MGDIIKVAAGQRVELAKISTAVTGNEAELKRKLTAQGEQLEQLQGLLYPAARHSVLIVLQGMDASGKEDIIEHVIGAFNPLACNVVNFRKRDGEEQAHDYLWRVHDDCPERGEIAVFDRSHYEAVLGERVLGGVPSTIWRKRYAQINRFEEALHDEGTIILKFFLHMSKDEQKRRLQRRLDDPAKQWKASPADWQARRKWDDFMAAYEDVLRRTSTEYAPWYIVPSDNHAYCNLQVAEIIIAQLDQHRKEWEQAIKQQGREKMQAIAELGELELCYNTQHNIAQEADNGARLRGVTQRWAAATRY